MECEGLKQPFVDLLTDRSVRLGQNLAWIVQFSGRAPVAGYGHMEKHGDPGDGMNHTFYLSFSDIATGGWNCRFHSTQVSIQLIL